MPAPIQGLIIAVMLEMRGLVVEKRVFTILKMANFENCGRSVVRRRGLRYAKAVIVLEGLLMQVKLSDIIEAIDFTDDGMTYYYNKKTGEVELVVDGMADDDAVADEIEDNFDQYLRLPSHYEINDYQKMVEFIAGLPAGKEAQRLTRAINGRGAFRRFRDELEQLELTQAWYDFKDAANRQQAIAWCRENQVNFTDEQD